MAPIPGGGIVQLLVVCLQQARRGHLWDRPGGVQRVQGGARHHEAVQVPHVQQTKLSQWQIGKVQVNANHQVIKCI